MPQKYNGALRSPIITAKRHNNITMNQLQAVMPFLCVSQQLSQPYSGYSVIH